MSACVDNESERAQINRIDEVHFSFDETQGAILYSSKSSYYQGILDGVSRSVGKSGGALYFGANPNGVVELSAFSTYPNNEISISAWVKFETLDSAKSYFFYGNEGGYDYYRMDIINNQFRFVTKKTNVALTTNYVFGVDTWYHVAFVMGATGSKFYVNGELNSESNFISSLPNLDLLFYGIQYLGSQLDNSYYNYMPFPGYIDEFDIARIEKSSSEIVDLYTKY